VVQSAQRDGEFVADPAPKCRALRKPQMMCVGRPPVAQQARLQGNELEVIAVAVPAWLAQGKIGFVDPWGSCLVCGRLGVAQRKRQGSVERQSAGVEFLRPAAFARLTRSADLRC